MRRKDFEEAKKKSLEDLTKMIGDLAREKTNARLEVKMGKLKNVHIIRQKKKAIAQLKTIIAEKNSLRKQ